MQRQTGLSSTIVVIAMLVGGEWLGIAGVVLAIPTAAAISAIPATINPEQG
jgi:predicted PurR-regulated permease PerM